MPPATSPGLYDVPTDVVTVPDFTKPKRYADFTARTLFFLASWEARAASAKETWRLHLTSIGEPPLAVRKMAEEVGAEVHVSEPFFIESCKFINKLRGLEIPQEKRIGERVLLLDTDIFFVGDPRPVVQAIPPRATSAALAGGRGVPESYWPRIYKALGLPEPTEREPLLAIQLGLWDGDVFEGKGKEKTDLRELQPYYNGGVLLFNWDAPLYKVWPEHLMTIYKEFQPPQNVWEKATLWLTDPPRAKPIAVVTSRDQAGLATTVQALKQQGWPFVPLPYALNARNSHFQSGLVKWEETALWHAIRFGSDVKTWDQVEPHIQQYGAKVDGFLDEGAKRRGEDKPPSTVFRDFVNELWENRVAPLVAAHPIPY